MTKGHHDYSPEALAASMNIPGVSPELRDRVQQCVAFHTYPAPGVLIGAFMVDYALELLGANPEQKLYAVCETPKCLPDAVQVIARCTTGNQRLRVVPIGKFAITLNGVSDQKTTDAIRVYVDLEKLKKFPTIDTWYANSPAYDKATMKGALQDEIFRAGRAILSFERVQVGVRSKRKWKSVTCPSCGETVPDYMIEGDHCGACGSMKYYKRLS
ncbi:MAG: formylmethanofuran dehydrogenase subunit E family protein [Methanoregula sp.]|jgi:formylmethanofuran dehydrogenase subunit E|uniref:FmdE family protein n=1 Tax=Methanoregula sp. TaxID=2052170 RepID=UPI003C1E54B2